MTMLPATWNKNDRKAHLLILSFSLIVFAAVVVLGRIELNLSVGFDVHVFAMVNACINTAVALLLLAALAAVRRRRYHLHRNLMLLAMGLSILFLLSYIAHHLLAGETRFGDLDGNGLLDAGEKTAAGTARTIYYIILGTHIPLAGLILPFILYSAYRALTGEFDRHRKLVRITWPVWFYVAVTGVIVYLMIRPYY